MAQVTMAGTEYAELLKREQDLDKVLTYFRTRQEVCFTEESLTPYSVGKWPEDRFPEWLHDQLVEDMLQQLLYKDREEFMVWVKSGLYYYDPLNRNFTDWRPMNSPAVDMLEYSEKLKARWDLYLEAIEAEKNQPTEKDTEDVGKEVK